MTAPEPGHNKTATSRKLDWLGALAVDPAVKPYAFKTGFAIVQHVNARTGWAMVSDETLADETSMTTRHVRRGRDLLRQRGWIQWKRTKTANLYRPLSKLLNSALDLLTTRRDDRQERRGDVQHRWTPRSYLTNRKRTPRSYPERTPRSGREWTHRSYIHLRGTP